MKTLIFHFNKEGYDSIFSKNQVDRIQCNDTGKRIYETLAYLYKESQHR